MKDRMHIILTCFGFIILIACGGNGDTKKASTNPAAKGVGAA